MAAFSLMVTAMPDDQLLSGLESTRATVRPCDEAIGSSCCVTVVRRSGHSARFNSSMYGGTLHEATAIGAAPGGGDQAGWSDSALCAELKNRGPVPD